MHRLLWLSSCWLLLACGSGVKQERLPVLGPMELTVNTKGGYDTTFFDFPDFRWLDQDSLPFTPDSLSGQIFLVDFFFTTCPSICKDMQREMKKVYAAFGEQPGFRIVSHSIDAQYDSPRILKAYADASGVTNRQWLFIHGAEEEIYRIAQQAYLSLATTDSTAPGGLLHSGSFILLDPNKKIRGIYDGTDAAETVRLLQDIPLLLQEFAL